MKGDKLFKKKTTITACLGSTTRWLHFLNISICLLKCHFKTDGYSSIIFNVSKTFRIANVNT